MIKEIFEKKIISNMDVFVEIVSSYFGEEYRSTLLDRAKNIDVALVRGNGVVKTSQGQVYVGEEPVCVKDDDKSQIVLPVTLLEDKHGNVVFSHLLLHALLVDYLKEYGEGFNETIVDYMANDIVKILEKKNINITLDEEPSYESNSFYSKLFYLVDDYYKGNRKTLVDFAINGDVKVKGIKSKSLEVESKFDELIFVNVEDQQIKRRK